MDEIKQSGILYAQDLDDLTLNTEYQVNERSRD